ncbi:MAG: T9SS type A sorting domain-containing protein [Bacteroidota bacterium]
MKKLAIILLVLLMSTAVYAQTGSKSSAKSFTSAFETPINGLWQYNSSANVYYIVGINYCASPANTTYEQMGIFVPGAYMNATNNGDGTYTCTINSTATVNGYTASEAPIVVPINTPGYSAMSAPTGYSSSVATYTNVGFIYLWPGCRGNTQGAPLGVTDLKAAVKYYRYLKAAQNAVPGNTDRIFSFGMSGGGAQSAIFGASGNSNLYTAYLTAIGAESGYTDNICGSMCWCPVTNLDQGDEAHEWNMGLTRSSLSTANASISKGLAADFATYVNAIGFKNPSTGATLTLSSTSNGYYQNGSYYEYVMGVINNAVSRYNSYNSASVSSYSTTDTLALYSFVSNHKIATKGLGAYDDYATKANPENKLFGIAGTAGHFDQYLAPIIDTYASSYSSAFASDLASSNVDAVGKTVQERLMMYTPLYYLINNNTYYSGGGSGSSDVAPYWRIRTGINQPDAPLPTEIDLALALQNYNGVMGVDFETIWGQAHVQAEDNGTSNAIANFITWVENCVATTTGVNGIKSTDESVKAYSLAKVIYIKGKLTGYTASIISINGNIVGCYKLENDGLITLDESRLVEGVYILRVNNRSKIYTFKLKL